MVKLNKFCFTIVKQKKTKKKNKKTNKQKKTLWPLFMNGVQLSQG